MKEAVEFAYHYQGDETDADMKELHVVKSAHDDGLNASDLCEAFVDFMVSAGFSKQSVLDYFTE